MDAPAQLPSCGDAHVFRLAWYTSLAVPYFHLFAFVLALAGHAAVAGLRAGTIVGGVANVAVFIAVWLLAGRPFECALAEAAAAAGNGTAAAPALYVNRLSFPALEGVLLGYAAAEAAARFAQCNRRLRGALLLGAAAAAASMLWFHRGWHVAASLAQGAAVHRAWHAALRLRGRAAPSPCCAGAPPPPAEPAHAV